MNSGIVNLKLYESDGLTQILCCMHMMYALVTITYDGLVPIWRMIDLLISSAFTDLKSISSFKQATLVRHRHV